MNKKKRSSTLAVAVVAVLALGALLAGSAQAKSWTAAGKVITGSETFNSYGTFKVEIPAKSATFNCIESGSGTISSGSKFEGKMTLNCTLAGSPKCVFSPVVTNYGGSAGSSFLQSHVFFIHSTGGACSWYEDTNIAETYPFAFNFGKSESFVQKVTSTATGTFGASLAYFTAESNWELTGAHAGQVWGATGPLSYSLSIGTKGSGNGQFNSNQGMVVDKYGNLWVVDKANNRVQEFNALGEYVTKFGSFGTGNGQFNGPTDIAIDPTSRNLLVTDTGNNRVQRFSESGAYISQFGKEGTGNGEFKGPEGLAINPSGSIWVVDSNNNRVQKFSSAGVYQAEGSFGSLGKGNGQFKHPTDIAIDSEGYLWVTDTENNRVEKFESLGGYESKFGIEGTGNSQFKSPRGIVIDSSNNLWVVDRNNRRVQEFSNAGTYITQFGKEGTGEGQFGNEMSYLAFDLNGGVWVGDAGNGRIQRWWN